MDEKSRKDRKKGRAKVRVVKQMFADGRCPEVLAELMALVYYDRDQPLAGASSAASVTEAVDKATTSEVLTSITEKDNHGFTKNHRALLDFGTTVGKEYEGRVTKAVNKLESKNLSHAIVPLEKRDCSLDVEFAGDDKESDDTKTALFHQCLHLGAEAVVLSTGTKQCVSARVRWHNYNATWRCPNLDFGFRLVGVE